MTAKVCIELPYMPPREFSRNSRLHWAALHRVQEQVNSDVEALLMEQGWRPGETWEKAQVKLTLYLPDKRDYDWDNLVTRCKAVIDGLKNAGQIKVESEAKGWVVVQTGFIKDDSLRVIGIPDIKPCYRKGKPGTLIEVKRG